MKFYRIGLAAMVVMLLAALTVTSFAQNNINTCPINPSNGNATCRMTPLSQTDRNNSIGMMLQRDNRVSIFSTGIQNTELQTILTDQGPFTLFVPTNEAFMRLPEGTRNSMFMSDNRDRLRDILMTHIVQGQNIPMRDLRTLSTVTTANCQTLSVRSTSGAAGVSGGDLYVGNARIVGSATTGTNGTIYYVDNVLLPGCSDVNVMNDIYINNRFLNNNNNNMNNLNNVNKPCK